MDDEGKIVVQDKNGIKKAYFVLASLEYKNKEFIIYTDYQKNNENKIKIYSGEYITQDEAFKIEKIKQKDEIKVIDEYIKALEKDILSRNKI